ncbi:zinc-ribbon domain-containing protein [Methanobrevibacter sp.]
MANFCIMCGNKLGKDDNYCTKCGTKIDKSDVKSADELLKTLYEIKELKKANKNQIKVNDTKDNEMSHGGYCDLNCIHCREEFLDSEGAIVGDFTSEGIVEYYCNLGHSISYGSFCKDYE